ncbi:hypothetical protein BDA99DRAFT_215095 [Phascolomyces articulosus]|uniref:Uncharacterized protein n=1 Tax=Phascolomyces articulosus TaxID=60185 RepID=A0AAD5K1Z7_9FUNG|nr:hypothetical protein BDA99DRAFT_215095 [Phascolomyces articulosus]
MIILFILFFFCLLCFFSHRIFSCVVSLPSDNTYYVFFPSKLLSIIHLLQPPKLFDIVLCCLYPLVIHAIGLLLSRHPCLASQFVVYLCCSTSFILIDLAHTLTRSHIIHIQFFIMTWCPRIIHGVILYYPHHKKCFGRILADRSVFCQIRPNSAKSYVVLSASLTHGCTLPWSVFDVDECLYQDCFFHYN